jgi:protein TonB
MQAVLGYASRGYGGGRALDAGFAASVVLHAVLLFALAGAVEAPRREETTPGPILVRLVAVAPRPVEAPPQEAEKKPPAPAVEPVQPVRVEEPLPAPRPPLPAEAKLEHTPAPVAPEPMPVVADPASAKAIANASPVPVPAVAQPARSDPPPLAAARSSPEPNRLDPEILAQYRFAIIAAAERHKLYPRAALDNNWEGRVEVRMVVGKDGAIASLDVKSSAGYEILDAQALDIIRRAWPDTPLPSGLRGREFFFDVPVVFELRDPRA